MIVYIVQHVHELPSGEEDVKFIGVYATKMEADAAVGRLSQAPGFVDSADGFCVDKYEVGKDHWADGFVTVVPATAEEPGTPYSYEYRPEDSERGQ